MTTQGRVIIGVFLLFAPIIRGQQTTTTNSNCNLYGNNANCTSTSTTTDNAAQQQQAYEAGQRVGSAIGQGIAAGMQAHAFSKGLQRYCDAHPGEEWHYYSRTDGHALSSGHCPSDDDKALAAANTFMAHHKGLHQRPGELSSSHCLSRYARSRPTAREVI